MRTTGGKDPKFLFVFLGPFFAKILIWTQLCMPPVTLKAGRDTKIGVAFEV